MITNYDSKPREVDIRMKEDCDGCVCTSSAFPTTYPPELQNHIHPNEFHQSITNINNSFPRKYYLFVSGIAVLFLVALALTIVGLIIMITGFQDRKPNEFGFLIGAVITITIGCLICFFSCRCYCNQIDTIEKMRLVIEQESKKYEERNCSWRLEARKDEPNFFTTRRQQPTKFHLMIAYDQPKTNATTTVQTEPDFSIFRNLDKPSDEQQRLMTSSSLEV